MTEILALDEIIANQASKEITHNTALRQIEGRTIRALDKDLTTPPGSPANGDNYIIPSGATGVWSGKTNQIAHFYGGAWTYWAPTEGVRLWLNDEDTEYVFDGTRWVVYPPSGAAQFIAYAASITPDGALGERVIVGTLTGNLTINAPTNPRTGVMLVFTVAQDAIGGRSITWNLELGVQESRGRCGSGEPEGDHGFRLRWGQLGAGGWGVGLGVAD
jgi:uncharacterized protein DUF2793